MTRLRWLTIVLPVIFIGGFELLSDTLLDPYLPFPLDTIVVVVIVFVVATAFSTLAFRQIDRLDEALRARNAELEARSASARALYEVSVAIAAIADLDEILRAIVDNARRLLAGEVALLRVADADGELRLRAWSGPPDAPEIASLDGFGGKAATRPPLEAPLLRGDEALGTLAVVRDPTRPPTDDDRSTLASLASQASIAIEADRLQLELRDLAVRGERERIARELHDGLAQVLGYVNTKSQAVDELLSAGRLAEARSQLAELSAAARSLYVDVREAILGLRGSVASGGGLTAALRVYARRFAEASKLAVRVEATDNAIRLTIDPAIEDEVFRIVREALTNVRKHAAAQRVVVRLDVTEAWLVVEVEDDGRGFDPAVATTTSAPGDGPQRLGLATIRERAAGVGGRVDWRSGPAGTTVRLTVPVEAEPETGPPAEAAGSASAR